MNKKNIHKLIYLSVCVGESTKQHRVDDNVPRQTLCKAQVLLNAVTGSCCRRALHLSASLSPPLRSSIPRSCRYYPCHQIAMMQGKPWSGPYVPYPLPHGERARQRVREDVEERKSPYREERDRLLVLSAGSEGAARTGEEKEMEGRERGINGKERGRW